MLKIYIPGEKKLSLLIDSLHYEYAERYTKKWWTSPYESNDLLLSVKGLIFYTHAFSFDQFDYKFVWRVSWLGYNFISMLIHHWICIFICLYLDQCRKIFLAWYIRCLLYTSPQGDLMLKKSCSNQRWQILRKQREVKKHIHIFQSFLVNNSFFFVGVTFHGNYHVYILYQQEDRLSTVLWCWGIFS